MTATAENSTTSVSGTIPAGYRRLPCNSAAYSELHDFLIDEAELLDEDLHWEWLALLTDDIVYCMPARETLYRRDGRGYDLNGNNLFEDNKMSLALRVTRSVSIESAFDREPPPRIRRQITNIKAFETDVSGEYAVRSYILLLRNRQDATRFDMLPARREDIIRRTPDGLRLARRTILVDASVLDSIYFNVFM